MDNCAARYPHRARQPLRQVVNSVELAVEYLRIACKCIESCKVSSKHARRTKHTAQLRILSAGSYKAPYLWICLAGDECIGYLYRPMTACCGIRADWPIALDFLGFSHSTDATLSSACLEFATRETPAFVGEKRHTINRTRNVPTQVAVLLEGRRKTRCFGQWAFIFTAIVILPRPLECYPSFHSCVLFPILLSFSLSLSLIVIHSFTIAFDDPGTMTLARIPVSWTAHPSHALLDQ